MKRVHLNEIYEKLVEKNLYHKFLDHIRKSFVQEVGHVSICSKIVKGKTYQKNIIPPCLFCSPSPQKIYGREKDRIRDLQ